MKQRTIASLLLALGATCSFSLQGATCIPLTPDGAGLQGCLDTTMSGDTILLSPGVYSPPNALVFPAPEGRTFFIDKALTIKGVGSNTNTILSGSLEDANAYSVMLIATQGGAVTLENLTISNGDASGGFQVGGGIVGGSNQNVTLNNVVVADNHALTGGGGIWMGDGSHWVINDSSFINNSSSDFGGAIAMFSLFSGMPISLSVSNSEFVDNTAMNFGGAIDVFSYEQVGASFSVSDSRFTDNSTGTQGIRGGAISAEFFELASDSPTGEIINSYFSDNRSIDGGAVYLSGGKFTVSGNTFRRNVADGSGGGLMLDSSFRGNVLDDNKFKHNRAAASGGGLYNRSIVSSLTNSEFKSNCAADGGGLFNTTDPNRENPSLAVTGVIELIKNVSFKQNHAIGSGGAIVNLTADGTSPFEQASINELSDSDIKSNWAETADAGISDPNSGVQIADKVKIKNNKIGGNCPNNI